MNDHSQENVASQSERVKVRDTPEAMARLLEARGWGDGLPVVPPTPERVARMVEGAGLASNAEIGLMPPRQGVITVEALAVNAVMAGCHPAYMPVLLTAARAVLEPEFSLHAIQATTHPVAPLIIVNGPIVEEIGLNAEYGCFAPGNRANATIGRAMRLMLLNVGGASPGVLDRATQGSPAKYAFCIAENEAASPWEPLHVERGFSPDESAVTLVGCEGSHNINDHVSHTAEGILATAADTMAVMGCNNFYLRGEPVLALGPEHAATIAKDGLTKADVKGKIFELARKPVRRLKRGAMWGMQTWGEEIAEHEDDDDFEIPLLDGPEDLLLIVTGGAGKHSCCMPTFGPTRSVTRKIDTSG